MAKYITMPKGELAGRVLLVDDLADSGVTCVQWWIALRAMPAITELRSAVIWVKGVSSYEPDYHVETLPTSPWIHQPFEEYDAVRPEALLKRTRSDAMPPSVAGGDRHPDKSLRL
jgi:hypoxanthine phosphoribosyltransferase